MRRTLLYFLTVVFLGGLVGGSLWAMDFDWGLTLDNAVSARGSEMLSESEWSEDFVAALWGRAYRQNANGGSLDLTVQGSYTYSLERPYIFDLDLLRFTGIFPGRSVIELTAGRFVFQDVTGMILDHPADGLLVDFLFPKAQIQLGGAYTGLLLNPRSDIRVSKDDFVEADDDSVTLGPSRALVQASITIPGALWYQIMTLQALAQFDLRDDDMAEIIHTQYLGLFTSWRLSRNFYLDSHLTLSSGLSPGTIKDTWIFSFLYGIGLLYFNEEMVSSRAHLKLYYSSGFIPLVLLAENFSLDVFRPINQPINGLVFNPGLGNIMWAELLYTFRPLVRNPNRSLANIQPGLAVRPYFRSTMSNVDFVYFDPTSDGMYLGTEIEASLVARVFSDLGLSLRTGVFLPGTEGFGVFTDERKPEFLVKVEISTGL